MSCLVDNNNTRNANIAAPLDQIDRKEKKMIPAISTKDASSVQSFNRKTDLKNADTKNVNLHQIQSGPVSSALSKAKGCYHRELDFSPTLHFTPFQFYQFKDLGHIYPSTQYQKRYLIRQGDEAVFTKDMAAGTPVILGLEEREENTSTNQFRIHEYYLQGASEIKGAMMQPNIDLLMQLVPDESLNEKIQISLFDVFNQKISAINSKKIPLIASEQLKQPIQIAKAQEILIAHIEFTHHLIDAVRATQSPEIPFENSELLFTNKAIHYLQEITANVFHTLKQQQIINPLTEKVDPSLNSEMLNNHLDWIHGELNHLAENLQTLLTHNYLNTSEHDQMLNRSFANGDMKKVIILTQISQEVTQVKSKLQKLYTQSV